ncbi:hypothetical protein HanPI659440_Chr09g0336941 [Helianthus annuus]|nr:hypothetical protein HanPI659440_Chr09g0336941 [Helianthus annuus]
MVEFDIPYDHFTKVFTNSCLDFNLGVIYPSNCLNFSLLGFEGEAHRFSGYFDQNTHSRCVFWCFMFHLIQTCFKFVTLGPYALPKLHIVCFNQIFLLLQDE